jgi:hypothetical protein
MDCPQGNRSIALVCREILTRKKDSNRYLFFFFSFAGFFLGCSFAMDMRSMM